MRPLSTLLLLIVVTILLGIAGLAAVQAIERAMTPTATATPTDVPTHLDVDVTPLATVTRATPTPVGGSRLETGDTRRVDVTLSGLPSNGDAVVVLLDAVTDAPLLEADASPGAIGWTGVAVGEHTVVVVERGASPRFAYRSRTSVPATGDARITIDASVHAVTVALESVSPTRPPSCCVAPVLSRPDDPSWRYAIRPDQVLRDPNGQLVLEGLGAGEYGLALEGFATVDRAPTRFRVPADARIVVRGDFP